MTTTEFPSLAEFYAGRPERACSGEADYGVHWHVSGRDWPRWRVSYVQATGEVYACEQRGACRVRVLGVVPPDPDERTSASGYRGGTYYRTLDAILDGWADPDVSGFDLAWIEAKLAAASPAEDQIGCEAGRRWGTQCSSPAVRIAIEGRQGRLDQLGKYALCAVHAREALSLPGWRLRPLVDSAAKEG